jgi:uridine kinase
MIIGIGGVSRSGKSFLSHKLSVLLGRDQSLVISQDDYVNDINLIPKIQDHTDWESPLSIDFKRFAEAISHYKKSYQYIIAEGLFAFYDSRLLDLYDIKIHIHISFEEFVKRKKQDFRWGKEPDWYIQHIWDAYLRYGIPDFIEDDYLRINGEKDIQIEKISHLIRAC